MRHQLIIRVARENFPNVPVDTTVVAIVTNPYNDCVDIILSHPDFPEVAELEVPIVVNIGRPASPREWAMKDNA